MSRLSYLFLSGFNLTVQVQRPATKTDVGKPILTIQIDDSERVVLVQLPATSIAAAAETSPNETMIEVVLNGAS